MVQCPKCLGTGKLFKISHQSKGFNSKCNLCDGEKEVPNELKEDFISSLNPFENEY